MPTISFNPPRENSPVVDMRDWQLAAKRNDRFTCEFMAEDRKLLNPVMVWAANPEDGLFLVVDANLDTRSLEAVEFDSATHAIISHYDDKGSVTKCQRLRLNGLKTPIMHCRSTWGQNNMHSFLQLEFNVLGITEY